MNCTQRNVTFDPMPSTNRTAAAEARVLVAVGSLREAQRLLEEAAQALAAMSGMGAEGRRLNTLHERVTRAIYDVRGRADSLAPKGRLLLDHEPDAGEARWSALWRERS